MDLILYFIRFMDSESALDGSPVQPIRDGKLIV